MEYNEEQYKIIPTANGCQMSLVRRHACLLFFLILMPCCHGARSMDLAHSYRLGPKYAPVEVVVFSDFQCAFCKRAAAEMRRINTRRPGRVKFYFKHYPLSYHPQANNAARASQAAGAQGKFWEMHDLLYGHATELNDEIYADLAAQLDLDVKRFNADMSSSRIADEVSADRAKGEALGIDGTPYFFIDRIPFHGSYLDLEEAIARSRR